MIHKSFVKKEGEEFVRVTFTIPNSIWADKIFLVGDFNHWDHQSHPFRHDREGYWRLTITLEVGRAYQFRYLLDGRSWSNDDRADAYVHNPYGSDNFVVVTDPKFKPYCDQKQVKTQ